MSELSLSVVLCTHDRPADLERCLTGLQGLRHPVEIVVVDSASDPPAQELVAAFAARMPLLRYVYEPAPGLSSARNRGVRETASDVVAFVDDDAIPAGDWAQELLAAFERPEVGCAGGECRPRFESPRPPWLSDALLAFAGITSFGGPARRATSRADWPFGANIAFRRAALERAGGFSAKLGRSGASLLSYEDTAMVERVSAAGWEVWLRPTAIVEHTVGPERCRSGYYWRRAWWNGVSRARHRPTLAMAAKRVVAVPLNLGLYALRRDRIHLYRTAESCGYATERMRARLRSLC
jgi:cellulose synthase/poly-beta-1,6-N-acetylglucosamine synthase-like glycosyltransferase